MKLNLQTDSFDELYYKNYFYITRLIKKLSGITYLDRSIEVFFRVSNLCCNFSNTRAETHKMAVLYQNLTKILIDVAYQNVFLQHMDSIFFSVVCLNCNNKAQYKSTYHLHTCCNSTQPHILQRIKSVYLVVEIVSICGLFMEKFPTNARLTSTSTLLPCIYVNIH